jgi:hypothetical protein
VLPNPQPYSQERHESKAEALSGEEYYMQMLRAVGVPVTDVTPHVNRDNGRTEYDVLLDKDQVASLNGQSASWVETRFASVGAIGRPRQGNPSPLKTIRSNGDSPFVRLTAENIEAINQQTVQSKRSRPSVAQPQVGRQHVLQQDVDSRSHLDRTITQLSGQPVAMGQQPTQQQVGGFTANIAATSATPKADGLKAVLQGQYGIDATKIKNMKGTDKGVTVYCTNTEVAKELKSAMKDIGCKGAKRPGTLHKTSVFIPTKDIQSLVGLTSNIGNALQATQQEGQQQKAGGQGRG